MVSYRRTKGQLIRSLIPIPVIAVVLYFVIQFFTGNIFLALGVDALVILFLLHSSLLGEQIRLELQEDGQLHYFERGKCKGSYNINNCFISFRSNPYGSVHDIDLFIVEQTGERVQHKINCTPIGRSQFNDLYERLKTISPYEQEAMRATPLSE